MLRLAHHISKITLYLSIWVIYLLRCVRYHSGELPGLYSPLMMYTIVTITSVFLFLTTSIDSGDADAL